MKTKSRAEAFLQGLCFMQTLTYKNLSNRDVFLDLIKNELFMCGKCNIL